MDLEEGKFTVELFAKKKGIKRQSAINLLSKLKKEGFVTTSGGGKQKRIYNITNKPQKKTNGFYETANKYSPEKLVPKFKHQIIGKYTIEHAIIDGIKIGDVRTLDATKYLFNQIKNWKRLFEIAKEEDCTEEIYKLYNKARQTIKCRTIPKRYNKK